MAGPTCQQVQAITGGDGAVHIEAHTLGGAPGLQGLITGGGGAVQRQLGQFR